MSEIYRRRREALAAALGQDAALITRLVNVRYLTGLAASNAAVLVYTDDRDPVLCTDGRYSGTAARICADLEIVVDRDVAATLTERAEKDGVRRLGFEGHDLTWERYQELYGSRRGLEAVPLGRTVEELRMVKDEEEITLLRRACSIGDRALAAVLPLIEPGMTERQIAVQLERNMIDLGADGIAFESIVASGPNGAVPHHDPGHRALADGDLITMDFGAVVGGYHSDMTRTVALGQVSSWQQEIYDLTRQAQQAGIDAAVVGADVAAVDAAARDLIKAAGYGDCFPHGLGHGVGLEIHEAPLLGYDKTGKLRDRVPVTAEPGVYLAGRGGVRIEDTLVVRANGPELLTQTTKELLVL